MPRLADLSESVESQTEDNFFYRFPNRLQGQVTFNYYHKIDQMLQTIADEQWKKFEQKLLPYITKQDPTRHWQQFHDHLYEVFGYVWLKQKGATNIEFLEEGKKKQPDLKGIIDHANVFIEVKNVNESDDGLKLWTSEKRIEVKSQLPEELKEKIKSIYERSKQQLSETKSSPEDKFYIYLIYRYDVDLDPLPIEPDPMPIFLNEIEEPEYPIVYHKL